VRRADVRLWSFGPALIAALALALTPLIEGVSPPFDPAAICEASAPFVVSLPDVLPPSATATASAAAQTTPTTVPSAPASPTPAPTATGSAVAPAAITLRTVLRADSPPAEHALRLTGGSIMPLVIPSPCQVPEAKRRDVVPCIALLPPAARLCAGGVVGAGRLTAAADAARFAFEAARVTVRDADGALRFDAVQGFVRYDDPASGLQLICPRIAAPETIGPDARGIVALCTNAGVAGWAISGQVTDGAGAAPDSVSFTIDAPDGSRSTVAGSLAAGAIVVRDVADTAR